VCENGLNYEAQDGFLCNGYKGLDIPSVFFFFGIGFELLFFRSAFWANPIFGQILEHGSGLNAVVGIAELRIIYITADGALPLAHLYLLIDF
jgi:hypothetical protein